MKILLLNTLYPPTSVGGAERSLEVLARGLAARGHETAVICLSEGEDSTENRDGVEVHRLAHGNVYWPFDGARHSPLARLQWHARDAGEFAGHGKIATLLEKLRPDVVHTNNLVGFGSNTIPLIKKRGLPIVHTLRDFGLICSRSTVFKDLQDCETRCSSCRLLTGRKAAAARGVDLVVGNSAFMVDRHRDFGLFQSTQSKVIYNAVPGILENRGAASATDGPLHLGYAGALKPEKGVEIMLDALRRLGPDGWKLTVAGTGDQYYVAGLKESYADLPVEWLGFVPIRPFLESIDLMIIPSIWPEPMPRTLIEAMAHRLPVLVSDAGGSPEVAAMYDGARIYPSRDVDTLAELLADAVASAPPTPSVDSSVLETFSVERLTQNYIAAYEEAIALNRRKTAA